MNISLLHLFFITAVITHTLAKNATDNKNITEITSKREIASDEKIAKAMENILLLISITMNRKNQTASLKSL